MRMTSATMSLWKVWIIQSSSHINKSLHTCGAKMDMKNSNKMSAWVLANDAGGSGRPRRLNPGFSSLSPGMESWHTEVKVRLPAVCLGRTHTHTHHPGMPSAAKPHHPSPFPKCHLRRPLSLLTPKLVKNKSRWQPQVALLWQPRQRRLLGEAQGCCATGGLATDQAAPGSCSFQPPRRADTPWPWDRMH